MWPDMRCTAHITQGQHCQTLLGSANPWALRTELSAMQKSKDVRMKLTWPQLEVQIWRRGGAVVKMPFGCQSDLQIYCGESLGQKIFMFFRSDRPLFCCSSSLKYLLALIVVRMNTNIFNQTIISGAQVSNNHLWCSIIKQSSLVVQFHIFYFNLSGRLSVPLLSRCSIKNLLRYQHLRNLISEKLISPSFLAS